MSCPKSRRFRVAGYTLVEAMVAATVLCLCSVAVTATLLQLNRRAAISRVMNAAKAEALSRIHQVQQLSYDPDADTPVIPTLLSQNKTTTVDLGSTDATLNLGSIPATEIWTVSTVPGNAGIRSVSCKISYTYMNRPWTYEVFTYKAPN